MKTYTPEEYEKLKEEFIEKCKSFGISPKMQMAAFMSDFLKEGKVSSAEVIAYLNEKTGRNFKNAESHRKWIRARAKEGFTLDDFKKVIDNKVSQSKNKPTDFGNYFNPKFLRPETLFGKKMDGYLNEKPVKQDTSLQAF